MLLEIALKPSPSPPVMKAEAFITGGEGLATNLETIGETYYNHRQAIMQTRQEGLTKTYNGFHDPAETSEDIIKLRQLHVEMDYAVAQTYGWEDLNLAHDFHETKQGLRYTISEPIRREILDRLLQLNFDRYAELTFPVKSETKASKAL